MSVDLFWINKISYKLDSFKEIKTSRQKLFNCRCPVCGDSKKKTSKKRFFLYEKSGVINVTCKKCGYGRSFYNFMKEIFPDLFEEYKKTLITERFRLNKHKYKEVESVVETEPVKKRVLSEIPGCVSIDELPEDHPCVKYLESRCLIKYKDKFLFSEDFLVTAKGFSYRKVDEGSFPSDSRLIIPFREKDGTIKALQGRSLDKNPSLKYITIKTDESNDKIYGLESLDPSKTVYCIEGPIDSMFLDNCIATCDSNLTKAEADFYIWDNQPRSRDIVKLMKSAIDSGKGVVIWPDMGDSKTDINELIIQGIDKKDIMNMIKERSFKGLRAKLEFVGWKKI